MAGNETTLACEDAKTTNCDFSIGKVEKVLQEVIASVFEE